MKELKIFFAVIDLLNKIKKDQETKKLVDTILDMIEDTFDGKDVKKACKFVRKVLDVPDND